MIVILMLRPQGLFARAGGTMSARMPPTGRAAAAVAALARAGARWRWWELALLAALAAVVVRAAGARRCCSTRWRSSRCSRSRST